MNILQRKKINSEYTKKKSQRKITAKKKIPAKKITEATIMYNQQYIFNN